MAVTKFPLMFRESVSSACLSHNTDCPCLICRAAHGDEEAMKEIYIAIGGDQEWLSDSAERVRASTEQRRRQ